MIRQLIRARRRYVLLDVGTQKDLLLASGKACVRNHRRVLANVRRMMAWTRKRKIPVISISDIYPNHNSFSKDFCIEGTDGQNKIAYTLLSDRMKLDADNNTDVPRNILRQYRQIILNKRCVDPFDEPRIERLLSEVQASQFILIGAATEAAVEATALGLLQRGKNLVVVTDAIGSRDRKEAEMAVRKMKAKGAKLLETRKLAGSSHLKQVGACCCKACLGNSRKPAVHSAVN